MLGWRERLALPELGIAVLRAKLDSGARTSSLHVEDLRVEQRGAETWLHFVVRSGRRSRRVVACAARASDRRAVTDSGGRTEQRWFIESAIELAGLHFVAEINLCDRRGMLFPMLLGRSALYGRFLIDPARGYTQSRPARAPATVALAQRLPDR